MSDTPTSPTIDTMPTEANFIKQAELAQTALKNFIAVRSLDTPSIIKPALHEVISATVRSRFIYFVLSFIFETFY